MNIKRDISLAPYTTFCIGGPADYFIAVNSKEELIEAIKYAEAKNMDFFVLGTGANILVGDRGFRGLVIKNESKKYFFVEKDSSTTHSTSLRVARNNKEIFLTADSGITIAELIEITLKHGLSGFEHFAGIPSTLGGALWQNLHFLSPDRSQTIFIGDIVESAEIFSINHEDRHSGKPKAHPESNNTERLWTSQNDVIVVDKNYFKFNYDYSILHDTKDIVLSAILRLTKEDPKVIQQRINANLEWRRQKHPENATKTSAGSVFKKISGHGAGRLIDQVGLKGYQIGGAKVSEKHANFIINTGNAQASDVRTLIDLIQKKVKGRLGLELETEISFVGEF